MPLSRALVRCLPALLLCLWLSPAGGQARGARGKSLEACTVEFLARMEAVSGDTNLFPKLFSFFPVRGAVTHHRDVRLPRGIREQIWRFPAEQARAGAGRGYWADRLTYRWDARGRLFGNFADRVIRTQTWRRAPGNRFVPFGEPDETAIYLQWRREGGRCVIAEIGDAVNPHWE